VVIAISLAALLFGGLAMGVGAITGTQAKQSAGELGGVIRSLYDTAALTGNTCRLAFELPSPKDEDGQTKYWAECASGNITTRRDREEAIKDEDRARTDSAKKKPKEQDRRFTSLSSDSQPDIQTLQALEKERVERQATFAEYTTPEIETRTLPSSVRLSVWTKHQRNVVQSGRAYLYFFPQGFTERAQLYVRQGDNVWTLQVSPLTGKTTVVAEALEVPRS
jgi:general secretion pathway protein H